MSDTPHYNVTSLEQSFSAPIERYFAADSSEQDIITSMLASIRTESTKREYRKDLNKFFKEMTSVEPNSDSVLEFLHLSEKRAVAVVLKYKGKLLERGLKEATVNRRITSIKSLVKFARKVGGLYILFRRCGDGKSRCLSGYHWCGCKNLCLCGKDVRSRN